MIGSIIEIAVGYVVWKLVPGMISHCPKNLRLVLEIIGIVLMIMGVVSLIRSILIF